MFEGKDSIELLPRILRSLASELERNPALREHVLTEIENERRIVPGSDPLEPKFDAIEVLRQGGVSALRKGLEVLEIPDLKGIITNQALDTTRLAQKWRSKERLVDFIIERMIARSQKGDAFRSTP